MELSMKIKNAKELNNILTGLFEKEYSDITISQSYAVNTFDSIKELALNCDDESFSIDYIVNDEKSINLVHCTYDCLFGDDNDIEMTRTASGFELNINGYFINMTFDL